jgi:hypothetical protein
MSWKIFKQKGNADQQILVAKSVSGSIDTKQENSEPVVNLTPKGPLALFREFVLVGGDLV